MSIATYQDLEREWCAHWFSELHDQGLMEWIEDCFNCLYSNPNLDWKSIQTLITRYKTDDLSGKCSPYTSREAWKAYSRNPHVTLKIVTDNPQYPWDWSEFSSSNPNVSLSLAKRYPDHPWDWYGLCLRSDLTPDEIYDHQEEDWNYDWLSYHPNMSRFLVDRLPKKNWDWNILASHPNFSQEDVLTHPILRTLDSHWCYNPNMSLAKIQESLGWSQIDVDRLVKVVLHKSMGGVDPREHGLAINYFSKYPDELTQRLQADQFIPPPPTRHPCDSYVDIELVFGSIRGLKDVLWVNSNFKSKMLEIAAQMPKYRSHLNPLCIWLTEQPFITLKDIQEHPEIEWGITSYGKNPNMTWKWLRSMLSDHEITTGISSRYWGKDEIATNPVEGWKEAWIAETRLRWIKANQIKRHWRRCSNDPSYKIGYRLVLERARLEEEVE